MNLSRNFTLQELIKIEKLKALCENILQPVRDHFGRVKVTSGFRSEQLCLKIGSSINSQHAKAEAADFECMGTDNAELADWIYNNLEFDQLILEFYTPGEPNSGWIHCSYTSDQPRKQFLHAYKSEGKTRKIIINKAFANIDTVHGHCEECDEDSILVAIVTDFYRCTNCGADTRQHVNGSIRYLKLTESDKAYIKQNVVE